jgi:hypothetical protein
VLSFQEDVIGVDNMMWGSDYSHSESTFPQSQKIPAEVLAGAPDATNRPSKPAPDNDPGIAGGNTFVSVPASSRKRIH